MPEKNALKITIEYIIFVVISIWMWRWAFIEVNDVFPDWDENTGRILGYIIIRYALFISWFFLILTLFSKRLIKYRVCFKIGIGLAFMTTLIRLVFYKKYNEFLRHFFH